MVHFPPSIPRFDSVPLVAFDYIEPQLAVRESSWKLTSWVKVEEVERRLTQFQWLIHVVRQPAGCTSFIGDMASAYLLSVESALQHLREEADPRGSDAWLVQQPAYDMSLRTLRTLRQLEAHVESRGIAAQHTRTVTTRFASGTDSGQTIAWFWPPIQLGAFTRLKHPKISVAELDRANTLLDSEPICALMQSCTRQLVMLFRAAEF